MNNKMNSRGKKTDPQHMLYKAFLTLKTPQEIYDFMSDLCTVPEMLAMEQRFEVAQMLAEGLIYTAIEEKTGASSATVCRVNRALNYGADGYHLAIDRLKEEEK